jgi:multidrug efflux pump subunit AcrB
MTSRRRTRTLAGALLLAGAVIAVCFITYRIARFAAGGYKPRRVISVQASYPGANAQVVADAVAAPIEQQVNGVEGMLSMSSQSANDGSYTLYVTFRAGTDLDMAQVLVQNRVTLAAPILPDIVQRQGVSVRKRSPEPLILVSLISPDGRFDDLYLSNYAAVNLQDELARLPGVGDVVLIGQADRQIRVWLDADKLAALAVTATDVATAISEQNVQVADGPPGQAAVPKGQQFQFTINTLGRLTGPEEFANVIVKVTPDGHTIRLKDVGRIETGSAKTSSATFDGRPSVLLSIYSLPDVKPGAVSRTVLDKLAELRQHFPEGMDHIVAFDFAPSQERPTYSATPEHLVIDVQLPDSASEERTVQTLERARDVLLNTPGVQHVLALTEHPFSPVRNRPCLVVSLTPKEQRKLGREQIVASVRAALDAQIPEARFRPSVPSAASGYPVYGFPIEFVIEDRGDNGSESLEERAVTMVRKMNESGKFSDVGVASTVRGSELSINVDRDRCQALGVEITEVFNTLQVAFGSFAANNLEQFGRTWRLSVRADGRLRDAPSEVLKLHVRNNRGQMVPLQSVVHVRDTVAPIVIERHNLYLSARVTANLTEGVSLAEAKSQCEALAGQELDTKQFKLIWPRR